MDQQREHGIIRQVLDGDREAFALLVEAHQQQLFHMAYVLTGNRHLAEDIVQETFVAMYDKLPAFRMDSGARLLPWLLAICRNAAYRQRKKQGRLVTGAEGMASDHAVSPVGREMGYAAAGLLGSDPEANSPEDALFRTEQGRNLARRLMQLPLELREALVLRFTEELSFKELASVLGVSLQAAKMRVYRGLAKLRESMPEDDL